MSNLYSLSQLGWKNFYQQQLSLEEWEHYQIVRIESLERSTVFALGTAGKISIALNTSMPAMTVGDWLLLEPSGLFSRQLERLSLFSRKSAGSKVSTQFIAANIDSMRSN